VIHQREAAVAEEEVALRLHLRRTRKVINQQEEEAAAVNHPELNKT